MFSCFTDKTFFRKFIKIAIPVMIASLISFVVGFVDNIMVGTVSNETVSGVYAANEVSYIDIMIIFGLLEGAGIFIQQYKGSSDSNHIKQCFSYKVIMSIIAIIIVLPLVYLFGDKLIWFYSHKDSNSEIILKEGTDYLKIVALSYIPFMFGYSYSTSINELGKTRYTMYAGIIAIISNVVFNSIFIFGLDMGGKGAAIATVISRVIECIFLIVISHAKHFEFVTGIRGFGIDKSLFKAITKKSIFLFVNEMGFTVGVILQSLAYSQRDGVLSAISIITTISNIFQILINSLSVGIGVIVGYSLGANKFDEAVDENRKLNFLGLYMSLALGLIIISLNKVIPLMFSSVDEHQKILASKLLIIYGALMFAHTLSLTSYFTLRVGGKTGLTMILDTGLMFILYIPVSWLFVLLTNLDLVYIFLIVTSLDIIKSIIGIIMVKSKTWVRNITI